jgi:beta-lactamase class A
MTKITKKNKRKIIRSQYVLALVLFIFALIIGVTSWFILSTISDPEPIKTTEITTPEVREEPVVELETFDSQAIQKTVDDWAMEVGGITSVIITDYEGDVLAQKDSDKQYFAASIYKLYVAYAGYQQIDDGEVDPQEIYINGNTRIQCLDLMIRDSDSPCAEKLWNELGREELTRQLEGYGILNTSMSAITTSAKDAALLLSRIESGEGLSEASRLAFLDSMKTQETLYRRGLPSGFSDSVTVYNKVGWNELKEWHDAAIVEFSDGRKLIVSVFTENVGISNVSELAARLEKVLLSDN